MSVQQRAEYRWSAGLRSSALVRYYNDVRLSRGIGGRTPRGRLTEKLLA
jgi:hypothetical protein